METKTVIICPPDTTARPLGLKVEKLISLPVSKVFHAWTSQIDLWFASPGSFLGKPEPNAPFYFETLHEGMRHAHYGRFLRIEEQQRVEFTWVTGEGGTNGAETVVTVELAPHENGTYLKLTHAGFADVAAKDQHENAWPTVLDLLAERMSRPAD